MKPLSNNLAKRFLRDDAGLETIEYAVMIGLVVAGSIAILAAIGAWVSSTFATAQSDLGA